MYCKMLGGIQKGKVRESTKIPTINQCVMSMEFCIDNEYEYIRDLNLGTNMNMNTFVCWILVEFEKEY